MKRNLVPAAQKNGQGMGMSQRRSIVNHMKKIGTMVNAPTRLNNQVPQINSPRISDSSDDEYLDDYLIDSSESEESDSEGVYIPKDWATRAKQTLTLSEINSLPESVATEDFKQTCAICIQDWACGQKYKILPCAHKFHGECIKDWLQRKNMCPCCKATVF